DALLVGLGEGGGAPVWLADGGFPDFSTLRTTGHASWLDASELHAAAFVGNPSLPLGFHHLRSSGGRLYSVNVPLNEEIARLQVFSLSAPPAAFDDALAPLGEAPHPPIPVSHRPTFVSVAFDEAAGRAATVLNDHEEGAAHLAF